MRVKEILTDYNLCVVDLEVQLNGETRNAPTLCVSDGKEVSHRRERIQIRNL